MGDVSRPPRNALALLAQASAGHALPPPEPMPLPDLRQRLPMRDSVRLDTSVWLPKAGLLPTPAILLRTPYKERVLGFKRLGVLRYVEAGYAVVIQQIRGIGDSEGNFEFSAPAERTDGHDTIQWIATQPWCNGRVGMDGSSYGAMMQLAAAVTRPPALRCIVPTAPTLDYFREVPYCGGIFSRQHTLNWSHLLQVDSLAALEGGLVGSAAMLARPGVLLRLLSRPLADAADGLLEGDFLRHYRDVLDHPLFDDWWQRRTLDRELLRQVDVPALVVSGSFDLCIGTLALWRGLQDSPSRAHHRLLIGPWDHGQAYTGGATRHGPYLLPESSVLDLPALRLAFFDQHLRERGNGWPWPEPARVFVTGDDVWSSFSQFPPREARPLTLYLDSSGHANSVHGDGRLEPVPPLGERLPDVFVDDPARPFVQALASAQNAEAQLDLHERHQHHGTLVYRSAPLSQALRLLGEGRVELHVAADVPDADLACWLAEQRADGLVVQLATGQLRLRYRDGFDRPTPLQPGVAVSVCISLTYVAHTLPAGSRLHLLVSGGNFPWGDPNPHTGRDIAMEIESRVAVQSVFHEPEMPSRLVLPTWPLTPAAGDDIPAEMES